MTKTADTEVEKANNLIAAGAVYTCLTSARSQHSALTQVRVVTDTDGNATNQVDVRLSFMRSRYRITVERIDDDADAEVVL